MSSLRPLIFSFNFILSSSHKTRAKLLTTPSFVKTPLSTSTPMPHTASTNRPLSFCSPIKGLPIIGTWAAMLSMMELYPKWVMNTPTASWAKASVCGAQGTILPFSLLFSRNPSGKYTCHNNYLRGLPAWIGLKNFDHSRFEFNGLIVFTDFKRL